MKSADVLEVCMIVIQTVYLDELLFIAFLKRGGEIVEQDLSHQLVTADHPPQILSVLGNFEEQIWVGINIFAFHIFVCFFK